MSSRASQACSEALCLSPALFQSSSIYPFLVTLSQQTGQGQIRQANGKSGQCIRKTPQRILKISFYSWI